MALCGGSLDDAFLQLVATAKRHNVDAMTLAATIVALAEDPTGSECDRDAVYAATDAWEPLVTNRIARARSAAEVECPVSLLARDGEAR
jgi:hypothetical protein